MSGCEDTKPTQTQQVPKNTFCTSTIEQNARAEQSFGLILYTLRNRLKITQREAAKRCAISAAYLGELENSKRTPPPPKRVLKIANALGASDSELALLRTAAQSERLKLRDLPKERADLLRLVQHLLIYGPSLDRSLVEELHRRATDSESFNSMVGAASIPDRNLDLESVMRRNVSPS